VDGIVKRQWAGLAWVQILAKAREFTLFHNIQKGSGAHPASYSVGTSVLSPG